MKKKPKIRFKLVIIKLSQRAGRVITENTQNSEKRFILLKHEIKLINDESHITINLLS